MPLISQVYICIIHADLVVLGSPKVLVQKTE